MPRPRLLALGLAVFVVGLLLGVAASYNATRAQDGFSLVDSDISPEWREEMYAQIGLQVAELERHGNILKTVVRLVRPTVVHIEAEKTESTRASRTRVVEEAGSGVIVEMSGRSYVVTNRHVIKDAELANISIKCWDGLEITPSAVWSDTMTDVAVMAVPEDQRLIAARVGDSDGIEIGDFVLAVGSPFGLSHSVTYGIISAKGRRDLELGEGSVVRQDFMQTDAAINPGNSGGPLLNLRGEVVGINTAIASNSGGNEGIGFSIPINMAMVVVRQLVERGSVERAFLGVFLDQDFSTAQAVRLGLPRRMGARVTNVSAGSPAAEANLQVDDVIVQFNGMSVEDDRHLQNIVFLTGVGAEAPVVIIRERRPVHLTVRLGVHGETKP